MIKGKKELFRIILVLIISMFCSYHLYYYTERCVNEKKVDSYVIETNDLKEEPIVKKEDLNVNKEYLGVLFIPKINLKQGFYSVNDSLNTVDKNIQVLKNSEMPNIKGSLLVLAAHSGNSYLGYFNNLDKLIVNDEVFIYYQKQKYQYIIDNIYQIEKNGNLTIQKNIKENYLVLTTCVKNENKQLVIEAKMVS